MIIKWVLNGLYNKDYYYYYQFILLLMILQNGNVDVWKEGKDLCNVYSYFCV